MNQRLEDSALFPSHPRGPLNLSPVWPARDLARRTAATLVRSPQLNVVTKLGPGILRPFEPLGSRPIGRIPRNRDFDRLLNVRRSETAPREGLREGLASGCRHQDGRRAEVPRAAPRRRDARRSPPDFRRGGSDRPPARSLFSRFRQGRSHALTMRSSSSVPTRPESFTAPELTETSTSSGSKASWASNSSRTSARSSLSVRCSMSLVSS